MSNRTVIDYRELLKKYIKHVGDMEGVTFLGYPVQGCTPEEYEELKKLDKESEL